MLDIPDKLKFIFSDYKFNLIQMRSCKDLHFHNSDINTVFDLSSSIYNRDYEKINSLYKNQPISPELALVVGAITESQELIDHALENEKKGAINMCTALEAVSYTHLFIFHTSISISIFMNIQYTSCLLYTSGKYR